ncbi:unnamed protein product [Lactuca saligna]|uniref:Uncharacterized protein n=1 Tax=Lactuca saligna TaxID=75948 RepID=A0AA35ZQP5_LACSI|nr:unnamed protein product [Lactuca saligna]
MLSRFEISRCSLIKLSLPIEFETTASILLQFCPDLELIHGSVFDFVAIALGDLKLCYEKRSQLGNSDFLSHINQLVRKLSQFQQIKDNALSYLAFLLCNSYTSAESLEKLLDVTKEELPDTLAAVRLSGMEINDLTMELSDLGQEITQGVKSSTRAVRLAEERLRRLKNMNPLDLEESVVDIEEVKNDKLKKIRKY